MHILQRLFAIARPYTAKLLFVAIFTSLGALGELVEPWVYRAIVNDIAGVFVSKESGIWPEILEELRTGGPDSDVEAPAPSSSSPAPSLAPSAAPGAKPDATVSGGGPVMAHSGLGGSEAQSRVGAGTTQQPAPGDESVGAQPGTAQNTRLRTDSPGAGKARQPSPKQQSGRRARLRHLQNRIVKQMAQAQPTPVTGQAPPSRPAPAPTNPILPPQTVSHAMRTLWLGVLILLGAAVLAKFFTACAEFLSARTTNEMEESFILNTFRHVLRLPFSFFTKRSAGSIARQIDQADQMAPLYAAVTQEVWSELFTAAAILVVMLSVNLELSLIVLIAVLVYLLVTIRMTRHLEAHLEDYYALWDDVSGRIHESVAGVKTVRTLGNEDYEVERTSSIVKNAFRSYLQRARVETRYTFTQNVLIYVSKALVLGLGGMRALQHQLTPGDVVMFMAYLDRIYSPVHNLTGLYSAIQRHVISLLRAFRLLDIKEEERGTRKPVELRAARVEFCDVEFAYREGSPVLLGVNFSLEPGLVTALIGPSGAGKTTIADLLAGIYRPQRGSILVNGEDLSDLDLNHWRKQISVVSPEGAIFRDTLTENIRYARLDADDKELRLAADKAGLGPAIDRLPEGMDTVLGERGFELSLGERQRVLLARAFLANPKLLILDEATANLDFKTEAAVKRTLLDLTRGRTTVIIAHRQSMMTDVDRVIAIRDGRVIEDGTPQELLDSHGYFFQMMSAQAKTTEMRVQ
jgi:ABC-type multidrug transport system fused ATPase/permease subunit